MTQTIQVIETLGSLGLVERLDEETKTEGLSDNQLLIDLVKDKKYKRVQIVGDDFIPDICLYNTVGAIYPLLDRRQRDEAIKAHLNQFDGLNYAYVNSNHTPYIREPLLLSDIVLARPFYWPGLTEEKQLWDEKSFAELEREIMVENGLFEPTKVKSDFLVALALMRRDVTSFGEDYVKLANPEFLSRVIKGFVALTFADTEKDKIDETREKLYRILPKSIHDGIEPLRQETDLTYAKRFRYR